MPFTEIQEKALKAKLNGKCVKMREQDGMNLSYVEGWHVIAEANRIFGYDAWDRKMVHVACVWEGITEGLQGCSYVARVQIRVRAGGTVILREGCGSGHGLGLSPGEAHESAIKKAETDAMKRALITFGNPFGLALYDREQRGVRRSCSKGKDSSTKSPVSWVLFSATGEILAKYIDPVEYCAAVRRELDRIGDNQAATAFWKRNQATVADIRKALPNLKTDKGQHYAEILGSLFTKRLQGFVQQKEQAVTQQPEGGNGAITCARKLPTSHPRRVRDNDHLRFVAGQPCLVCERCPSQAHHLKHAQPRAMGRKPSDEWVVPLCNSHHRSLHDAGNEAAWWQARGIEAIKEAERLWGSD